jgi:hypothetical protein
MNKNLFVTVAASALFTAGCSVALAATGSGYVSQTTASISIAPRDNLIVATTIVNWDTRASDTLAVQWIAPQGSFCRNSQFVLSRGPNVTGDVSWAYRTVMHTGSNGQQITCDGHWVANIVNVNTNQVLASAGYTVTPATNTNS